MQITQEFSLAMTMYFDASKAGDYVEWADY